MDRFESMLVLVAAVEAGSFSAASRKLGMPLATVSRKVSELERHLKSRLLNRTSRRLTLTDAGREYHTACRRILDEVRDAEQGARGEYSAPRGELKITAPIVFGRLHVLPIVIDFLRAFPDVVARLILVDRVTNLFEEHIDAAVRIGELPDSSLIASRIGAVRLSVCASPAYLAERGTPKQPQDLRRHDCIAFEGMSGKSDWSFESRGAGLVVEIHPRLSVTTAEAAVDAAIAGIGFARVFSYQMAQAERDGALVRVLRGFEPTAAPISLVYPAQPLLPLKLRAFLDFTLPRLKGRVARPPVARPPGRV
jgi:DNA-binding transcriptional LysR family regulator